MSSKLMVLRALGHRLGDVQNQRIGFRAPQERNHGKLKRGHGRLHSQRGAPSPEPEKVSRAPRGPAYPLNRSRLRPPTRAARSQQVSPRSPTATGRFRRLRPESPASQRGCRTACASAPSRYNRARTGGIFAAAPPPAVTKARRSAGSPATSGTGNSRDCIACVSTTGTGPPSHNGIQRSGIPWSHTVKSESAGGAQVRALGQEAFESVDGGQWGREDSRQPRRCLPATTV